MIEENKFDPYQFIGFILIAIILTWMFYNQQPVSEESQKIQTAEKEIGNDSDDEKIKLSELEKFGEFSSVLSSENESNIQTIENEKYIIKVNSKGGKIVELKLKDYFNHNDQEIFLINNNNEFNLKFITIDGRMINTSDINFSPVYSTKNSKQVLTMLASLESGKSISIIYEFNPTDFMLNFKVRSEGFSSILNNREPLNLSWSLKCFRNSKSIEYENRYTELTYGYDNDKMSYLSATSDDEDEIDNVKWIGYKQHFFNSILIPENKIEKVNFKSENLVQSEDKDQQSQLSFF